VVLDPHDRLRQIPRRNDTVTISCVMAQPVPLHASRDRGDRATDIALAHGAHSILVWRRTKPRLAFLAYKLLDADPSVRSIRPCGFIGRPRTA
jgi:hypothetical protein